MESARQLDTSTVEPTSDQRQVGWHILSGGEVLHRLSAAPPWTRIWDSRDGLGERDCLLAAACAAQAEGSEILLAASSDSEGEMLVPLRLERRLGIWQALPLASPMSQYAPAPEGQLSIEAFQGLLAALKSGTRADLLVLRRVRHDNPVRELLDAVGAMPSDHDRAPYIDLKAFGDFEGYMATFNGKTRRNRRRELNRLQEAGEVQFAVQSGEEAGSIVEQAIRWKRKWLQQQGFKSPVLDAGNWQQALLHCASGSHAAMSVLRVAGAPAAVELGFVKDDGYVAYMGAFDPAFGRLSVGQEQMNRTIAWCFDQGLARYDLLAPEDDYKRHWTRQGTAVAVADYAVGLSPAGLAASLARRRMRPLAKRLVLSTPPALRRWLTTG